MTCHDWQRAASFAARAHNGQMRRDGETPYVAHAFRVAMVVQQLFACDDPVCICAALLHDTIEDTGTDYDDILKEFGHEIADCVAALTKDMRRIEDHREREYDRQLAEADWRARLVKLADVYDNFVDQETKTDRMAARVQRAIKLAEVDAGYPESARALAAVRMLLVSGESGAA